MFIYNIMSLEIHTKFHKITETISKIEDNYIDL